MPRSRSSYGLYGGGNPEGIRPSPSSRPSVGGRRRIIVQWDWLSTRLFHELEDTEKAEVTAHTEPRRHGGRTEARRWCRPCRGRHMDRSATTGELITQPLMGQRPHPRCVSASPRLRGEPVGSVYSVTSSADATAYLLAGVSRAGRFGARAVEILAYPQQRAEDEPAEAGETGGTLLVTEDRRAELIDVAIGDGCRRHLRAQVITA